MKFLKRGKDKKKQGSGGGSGFFHGSGGGAAEKGLLAELPLTILKRIFAFVCPHSQDESYEVCEDSYTENACMLCDLRDLAHCVQACKAWAEAGKGLLYHSIRIDSVHYCNREIYLSEKRKRVSRFDYNGDPEDTAEARLKLLARTLREDATRLGSLVKFFKTQYMLRESAFARLAMAIAVMPNLRYVDLPEGLFTDEHCMTLRLEVQARCPEIRKMTYKHGAEQSFKVLGEGRIWTKLEVLELAAIAMDPLTLRCVLGALTRLRALKVSDMRCFNDEVFELGDEFDEIPPFPILEELILKRTPEVTEKGLAAYLRNTQAKSTLLGLTLLRTGVDLANLQDILGSASRLRMLQIAENVTKAIPSGAGAGRLASTSLQTLHFEIGTDRNSERSYESASTGYYTFVANSILAGGLPKLQKIYAKDPNFPDYLQGIVPSPPLPIKNVNSRPTSSTMSPNLLSPAGSGLGSPSFLLSHAGSRFSSNNPFANVGAGALPRTLVVYTRGETELDWSVVVVRPQMYASRGKQSATPQRARSSYGLGTDVTGTGFDGHAARRSVMTGNGAGGFLEIPTNGSGVGQKQNPDDIWPRPKSSGGERTGNRDLWR